jgi:hypothetical protein
MHTITNSQHPPAVTAGGLQVLPVRAKKRRGSEVPPVIAFGVFGGVPWRQICLIYIDAAGSEVSARAIADEIAGKPGAIMRHHAVEDLRDTPTSDVFKLIDRCVMEDAWPPPPVRIRREIQRTKPRASRRPAPAEPSLFESGSAVVTTAQA